MQLSDTTLQVLKNFSTINPNIVMTKGQIIRTMSEAKNIVASAELSEELPRDVGIYDLNEFLGVINLVDQPRIRFEENNALIGDSTGRVEIKYYYSDPDILTSTSKDINMPEADVEFTLDNDTINRLRRAASALGHTQLSIASNNNVITLSIVDIENTTSNTYSIDVDGEFQSSNFNFIININNLKMLPGDYNVKLSKKLISQFTNTTLNVKYWIAMEKTSSYE